jgi:hypothetical protein
VSFHLAHRLVPPGGGPLNRSTHPYSGGQTVSRYLLWPSRDAPCSPPAREDGSAVVVGSGYSVQFGARRRAASGPLLLEVFPHDLLSTRLT